MDKSYRVPGFRKTQIPDTDEFYIVTIAGEEHIVTSLMNTYFAQIVAEHGEGKLSQLIIAYVIKYLTRFPDHIVLPKLVPAATILMKSIPSEYLSQFKVNRPYYGYFEIIPQIELVEPAVQLAAKLPKAETLHKYLLIVQRVSQRLAENLSLIHI